MDCFDVRRRQASGVGENADSRRLFAHAPASHTLRLKFLLLVLLLLLSLNLRLHVVLWCHHINALREETFFSCRFPINLPLITERHYRTITRESIIGRTTHDQLHHRRRRRHYRHRLFCSKMQRWQKQSVHLQEAQLSLRNCSMLRVITGRPVRRAACRIAGMFIEWSKNGVFDPQGWHLAPSVTNFTFIGAEMWEYNPQIVEFGILPSKLPLGGDSFAHFFCEIYASISSLYVFNLVASGKQTTKL